MTADLTPTEVAALRERATEIMSEYAGDWTTDSIAGTEYVVVNDDLRGVVAECDHAEDAAYIAAADPATVLALMGAAYDDTGQPWRDRAETAEAKMFKAGEALVNEQLATIRVLESRDVVLAERDEARATIDHARTLAAEVWRESQADQTIIHDAGIMQDIVTRLRRALAGAQEDTT